MLRPLALLVAVGLFSSAVFLAVPEELPQLQSTDGYAALREDRTGRAVLLAGAGSLGCDPASHAPALAQRITPRRYDEVVKDELVLEVVREDGRPIAGATVLGSHEDTQLGAMTDGAGRAVLQAFADVEVDLTVARGDFVAHKRLVRLDPGTQKLVVPTRSSLKGRLRVRGSVPREPMGIGLVCGDGGRSVYGYSLLSISDAQGNVEFFNLPADWSGALSPPQGHRRIEPPFITTGVRRTWFARPRYDDGQPFRTVVLTALSRDDRLANHSPLGVPGDIDVGTFLNPAVPRPGVPTPGVNPIVNPGSIMAAYENPALEQPDITIVWVGPTHSPPAVEFEVHDVGIIDLIPMREIKVHIVDSAGASVTGAQAYVSNGAAASWFSTNSGTTFWVDDDRTIDQIRAAFWVSAPVMTRESWARVDGERIVMTESGNDEITVTVRDTPPVRPPDTSPHGTFVPFDITADR